jgi:hypothetical protein
MFIERCERPLFLQQISSESGNPIMLSVYDPASSNANAAILAPIR